MLYCSSGGSDPLNMSKSDILRGIITEKLSTAAREILAVVERTVADYEQEASGFRREIDRQRRQLELLQPEVRLSRGDVEAAESRRLTGNQCGAAGGPVGTSRLTGNQCGAAGGPVGTSRLTGNQCGAAGGPVGTSRLTGNQCGAAGGPVGTSRLTGNQCGAAGGPVGTSRLTGNQCGAAGGPVGTQEDLKDPDHGEPPRSGFPRVQTARRTTGTGRTRVGGSQNQLKKRPVKMEAGQQLPSEPAAPDPAVLESHGTGLHTSSVGAGAGSVSSAGRRREADGRRTVAMETQVCWNQVVEVKQEEGSVAQLALGPTGADQSGRRTSCAEGESDPGGDAPSDPESDGDSDSSSDSSSGDSDDESVGRDRDAEPATRRKTDKLTCRVCGSWYRQLGSLISHIWNHVNEPHGVCGLCGDAFESAEALRRHLPSHKKGYSCWICGKYLLSSVTLNRHVANHVTGAVPASQAAECGVCGKTFSTASALNAHSRVHLEKRAAGCRLCPKPPGVKPDLGAASTGSLGFSCGLCGETFALETSLKTHEKTHAASDWPSAGRRKTRRTHRSLTSRGAGGAFACGRCDMSFLSRDTLKVHMIVHADETPYSCSQCGRGFKRLAYLVNHIKTHAAAQQWVCAVCGQVSNGLEALEDHMAAHSGDDPVGRSLRLDPGGENTPEEPQGGSLASGGQESHI